MDTDLKKIKKLSKLMKREGLLCIKTPELELQLSPVAVFHETAKKEVIEQTPSDPMENVSDQEMYLWSAPGYATFPFAEGKS